MARAGELAGRTLSGRYEVLDLIGRGGMGEVYRARDRELDDLVALKVVRRDLLAYPQVLERFRREVKLARRVTHANVARAFELVVADEGTFYTMELVEGVPLVRRLASGRISIGEAAAIAVALCDALGAAHDAGIVHRDVKPGNVLLGHDGRIVLTDFGVAALSREELGELEGTPRFMAPEQARREAPTPAVDLYALGVMLYEMLAGAPAFSGNTAEILDAKQRVEHLAVDAVDPRLAELVASATHRDPARRPRSASAFRRAVAPFAQAVGRARDEAGSGRLPPLPTVNVRLPSAAVTSPHLAEGFHQALVDRLVQWPRLRVVPRDTGAVAGAILVGLAVQGGVLELAAAARPTQLVARFPYEIEALPRAAEQAARLIAVLAGSDAAPPAMRARALDPEAHELILRARHDARRDRALLPQAVARCERAAALAPDDPRVLAALATSQAQLAFYDGRLAERLLDAAARNALAALAADPELAEAHFARAHVELHAGRPLVAAVCFRAAIARAPLMAEAHEWLGRMLLEAGFVVDATARLADAFATGPLPVLRWSIVLEHALDGRWDEVDRTIAELGMLGISVGGGLGFRLRLAAWKGDREAELAAHAELAQATGVAMFERELMLAVHDPVRPWAARRDAILAMVNDRQQPGARRRAFIAQLGAEAAGRGGDVETCLAMLLRANAVGLFHLRWLDRCPFLAPVRGEPRYAVIRADVARRAEEIHDALYSDHRDQATVATAAAGSQ